MSNAILSGLALRVYHQAVADIEAGDVRMSKPSLSSLADHHGVSLSPVRQAVDQLVSDGYLMKSETGRLSVASGKRKGSRRGRKSIPELSAINLDLLPKIRKEIIRLSIQGNSDFVRERSLTEKYNLGRTALRSLMSKLAVEGLVELVPRRGWRPRAFDQHDLCSFLEVRESLEIKALELARPHLQVDRLQEFHEANQRPEENPEAALSNDLHDYWIGLSDNRYIQNFFARDAIYYRSLFDFAAPEAEAVIEMAEQHCDILTALVNKRWKTAERELRKHIQSQKPTTKRMLEKLMPS